MTLNGQSLTGASLTRTAPAVRGMESRAPLILTSREEANGSAQSNGYDSATPAPDNQSTRYLDRIVVRSRHRILFLDVAEVTWLEACGNYVRFHTPEEVFTVRGTLSSFEQQLDPVRFLRIHRSMIVNREVVREVQSRRTGDFTLITRSGERLTLSRNFRSRVQELRRLLAS